MKKWNVAAVRAAKGTEKLGCCTAYDACFARLADEAGVPIILVGDSMGMNTLGYATTLPVEMSDTLAAVGAVARAAKAGYNAMVLSAGEDTYWQAERRERVRRLDGYMKSLGMELIPCIWSMGYGGTVTYVDADTIESTPNRGLRFKVNGTAAKFLPDTVETGFEGRTLTNSLSLKLTGKVKPYRTYVFKCRCRTEKIDPVKYYAVRGNIYHGVKKEQELYDFPVTATQDWKTYEWEFNTYGTDELTVTVALNRNLKVTGACWFDSIKVEELPLSRCLTAEEVKTMQEYLMDKWLRAAPYVEGRTAVSADGGVGLANGGSVDFGGAAATVKTLGGGGTVSNFASLEVTDGFVFNVANGEVEKLTVNGDLMIGSSAVATFLNGDTL